MANNIFLEMQQEEEEQKARIRLAPYGELPTVDFTNAPVTAKTVNQHSDPMPLKNEWNKMAFYEKVWNAGEGAWLNADKSDAIEEATEAARLAKGGLATEFEQAIEDETNDEETQKILKGAFAGTRSDEAFKSEQAKKRDEAISEYLRLSAYDYKYHMPDVMRKASEATEGKGFWASIPAYWSEVAKDPLNYAIYLGASSIGAIAPSLALSMVGGVGIGGVLKMHKTASAVAAALMGHASYSVEFGSYIENYLQEKGYDLRDAESIRGALGKEDLNTLLTKAQRRAFVVGAFDGLSAIVAPLRLNPSNAFRLLRSASAQTAGDLTKPTSRMVRFGKGFENLSLQTTLQGVMGGAGEAFGQAVNGEKINWGEVFAEAVGEFLSAPVEVLGLSYSVNAEFNRDVARIKETQDFYKKEHDIATFTAAVANKIGDTQTVEQWAEGVGKGAQLFAFAQDLVDQKIPDKIRESNPELAEKIEKAAQEKKDITISMGDVLKTAVKDEATAKAMIYETRLTADGMSQRQAEEFAKNGKKEAIEKFQKIMEKAQPDVERRKAIDAEVDKAEERLVELGMDKDVAHTSTMPWRAFLSIRAGQLGKTPQEMMEKLKLRLQKDNQEAQQAFAQKLGDVRGNPEVDAQALTDFIQSAENPEVRQQAINDLLDLMSTERQKDVVKDNKAPTQKVYQKDIDARVREAAEKAGVDLADMESPVTRALIRQTIINDALYVVKSNPTAVGWYDLKVRQCLAYAEEVFPELNPKGEKFNPNELFKFLYILAVTSNGQKVSAQFAQTVGLYKEYKKTGKIPVKAFGPQGTAIAHALKNFPNLTEKFGGMDNMRKFFMTAWTVRQMTMMGFDVTGEAADEIVRGAMILGPKIGNGFLCNMYGIFSALTMDRWFMRTFGRWTGTLIEFKPEALNSRLVELKSALKELKSNKELANYVKDELGFDISKALQLLSNEEKRKAIVDNESALDGERGELVKMVQKAASIIMASEYHKKFVKQWKDPGQKFYDSVMRVSRALLTDKQSPRGATERKYIRGLFNDALEVLHNEPGLERLTMADLQALLWYAEKKIYENTKTEGDEYVEDYDTDEAPDYANAMYEIALKEGVSKEKLDSIKQRVEKEIEDEQRRTQEGSDGSEGSSGIGHDSLSEGEKVKSFRALVFGAMRSLRKLSSKGDKKQSQRSKTVYGKKWEVGQSDIRPANGGAGESLSDTNEGGNRQTGRGIQPTPIAEWVVGNALRGRLKEVKTSFGKSAQNTTPKFQEFAPTEQSATTFLEALRAAKQSQGIAGLCVEEKSIEELTGKDADHSQCRIFLSEDKKSGFVIKNGDDLVSVFSTRGHGSGDAIVECAIAAGARRLDCFNTILPEFYASHGFRPVARLTFDPNYAPEGWDYNYFGKFNEGKPDIIFMVLDNDFNGFLSDKDLASLPETQDYGTTECNAALEKYSKNNAVIQESVDEATANFQKPKDADTFAQSLADALYQLAYHGSPYRFDRFSLEHIGRGEGAQAHGWGLYFALNRAVAEGYKRRLDKGKYTVTYKGKPIDKFLKSLKSELSLLERNKPNFSSPDFSDWLEEWTFLRAKVRLVDQVRLGYDMEKWLDDYYTEDAKKWFRTELSPYVKSQRNTTLYTVDIPDDDVMLREDAPFDKQPKAVQEALKKIWEEVVPKDRIIEKKEAWLEKVKASEDIKNVFAYFPETYKAFIALAESEGPIAFEDTSELHKKLKTAISKDARVARKLNLENDIDDTLDEVAEAIWDEINLSSSALRLPYHLAKSGEFDGLVAFSKKYNSQFKKWIKEVRDFFDDDGEYFTSPKFRKSLVEAAKKYGPSIFQDNEALFQAIKPVWIKEAENLIQEDPDTAMDITGGEEMPTAEEVARGWFYNMLHDYTVFNLYDLAARDYRTLVASDITLLEENAEGWKIYDELKHYFHSAMKASLTLNKYGVKGIRYNGSLDGECAVVFDDTTIKIVDMLNQLAYHGTGVEKDILKFTLDHVGEGEGAQAHGYGLYFALLQQVARGYKDKLSSNGTYQVQGQDETEFRMQLERSANSLKGDERKTAFDRLAAYDEWYANHNVEDVKKAYERGEITEDAYKWFNKEVAPNVTSSGGLYLVDIPEDTEMLREDTTFAEQSAYVQERLQKAIEALKTLEGDNNQAFLKAIDRKIESSELASAKHTIKLIKEIAAKDGHSAFKDSSYGSDLMGRLREALRKDAEEEYRNSKADFDADEMTVDDIEDGFLDFASSLISSINDIKTGTSYADLVEAMETGKMYAVYDALTDFFHSKKKASEHLNKFGIKGIRYDGRRDGECAVVWDEDSIKILERLQQLSDQAGPEKIRGSYLPRNTAQQYRQSVITLMECYDKSTFLHESAHAWLDLDTMIASDLADKIDRGEELTEGEQAFMRNLGGFFKWGQQEGVIDLGVTDDIKTVAAAARKWAKMDSAQQRGMHELFAEGFEAYLMEGLAPNKEMQSLFDQFKKWLIDVYSKLVRQPRPISKEVRKLYDLMFATEQQAEETQVRLGLHAMFDMDMAKQLGMTDEEIRKYQELEREATAETAGLVAKKVHGAMRTFGKVRKEVARRLEKERKEEIKKREEELRKEPRYKALSMLNSNKVKMSEESLKSLGLSQETIDLFKERNWVAKEGEGVNLHVLASTVGTDSVMDLLYDLVDLERMSDAHDEVIKELAWEEGVEHEGEGDFRELQANLCAYNETRSRLLTAEFNAIMRKLGGQQLMVRAAREYALNYISGIKVSELHEKSYMAAERRCAKEAETAFRKGDFNAVVEAKRAQILNHELARAALEAKDKYERGERAAKKALKSKDVHPKYKRIINALLEYHSLKDMNALDREEFGYYEPLKEEEVTELISALKEDGIEIDGLETFLNNRKHVQEMTVSESNKFFDVLKQVQTIGRNILQQNLTKNKETKRELIKGGTYLLAESARVQHRTRDEHLATPTTRWERFKFDVKSFLYASTKIATWCKIWDQNKHGGFFWDLFVRPANEHANFEAEQRAKVTQYLQEHLLPIFKKNQEEDPIMIEGFEKPFTHGMRIAVALNWGNTSNRERLLTNDPRFTPDAIQQILDTLTEEDWRAVEAVWQLLESFRPMIAEKELRVYGIEPEWIEYEPFQVKTKEGKVITVSGGYYPVKYDPVASTDSEMKTNAESVEQEMKGAFQSATTRRSFTKTRVKGDVTGKPLRLDLTPLYEGLNDIIHDLAWHEWLIDTKQLLDGVDGKDTGLRKQIRELYGYHVAKEFETWRKDIALGGRSDGGNKYIAFFTKNIGLATMGYSLSSAAIQITGIGYVIPRVGVPAFTFALSKYLVNPFKAHKKVHELSQMMRSRAQTQFKELAQIRNRIEKSNGKISWLRDHAYSLMSFVQSIVDTICWMAAYEKLNRDNVDQSKLVAMCDQVVIDTQSSGNISDLSSIERSNGDVKSIFGVFYSWMNAALNLSVAEYYGERSRFKKVASLFFMNAMMPVIEDAFKESLRAQGDDDDDDDDPMKKYVRNPMGSITEYNLGLLLGLREISMSAGNVVKGEPVFGYSGPAGLRNFSNLNRAVASANRIADGDFEKATLELINFLGTIVGAPTTQINRTVKGLKAVDQGKVEGIDAIKAPLFGYKGRVD